MSNELMNIKNKSEQLSIQEAAVAFVASGMFPDVKSEAVAIVKILAGEELGIGRFQAMSDIDIIKGKAVPNSKLQACLIKSSGKYNYKVAEFTDDKCVLDFFELWGNQWEKVGESSFTLKDAQRAGITNNPTWAKYPKNMLFARALSNGGKWYCPDALKGAIYNESEIEEIEYRATEKIDNSGIEALKAGSLKKLVQEQEPVVTPASVHAEIFEPDKVEEVQDESVSKIQEAIELLESATSLDELILIKDSVKVNFGLTDNELKEVAKAFGKIQKEMKNANK